MGLNWALKPLTDKPSVFARNIADKIDNPHGERGYGGGFLAGSIEGLGDLASSMTSPMNIAGTALGVSPWLRGASELTTLGRLAPKAAQEFSGVAPSFNEIPKEWIASGAEDLYNAGRSIYKPMRSAEDIAYENIMRQGGRSSSNKNLLLDYMQKVQAAKGK